MSSSIESVNNCFAIIDIDQKSKWDSIVKSFSHYDVNYLNGYAKAFMLAGEGEPNLFYYNTGETRAIIVFMKRDIANIPCFVGKLPKDTWHDISTPYGYGGFKMEGDDFESVNRAFDSYCRKQGFVSEFVRFHLMNGSQLQYNGVVETHTHNVIRSLDSAIEDIFSDFEHKVRKNIKKAVASGLETVIDTTGSRLDDFLGIYYETMKRTNATETFFFTKEFFETLHEMKGNFTYFHVKYGDLIISTELVLYGSENCYSFLGGTMSEYFHLRPNDFLKFEIIKWAKAKGLKRFILGGGYGDDDGIFKYKKSLAPNGICDFYIGKRIIDKDKYEELLKMRMQENTEISNSSFFPAYRAK